MKKGRLVFLLFAGMLLSITASFSANADDVILDGVVKSTGGFKFPDNTMQTTAYTGGAGGVNITSPDGSIVVGGTSLAPTLQLNTLFGTGFTVDNTNSNTGDLSSGAIRFGGGNTGEGIASTRQGSSNLNGLDFYTSSLPRLSITNSGYVGIGTQSPAAKLHVLTNDYVQARFGAVPLFIENAPGTPFMGFNLYWNGGSYVYGSGGAGATINSYSGGLLLGVAPNGTAGSSPAGGYPKWVMLLTPDGKVRIGDNNTPAEALDVLGNIKSSGGVTSASVTATSGNIAGSLVVDNGNTNDGAVNASALTFGLASGEGIASRRTSGANQYGLDFYSNFVKRMSITQTGKVGIGTDSPAAMLHVAGDASSITGFHATTAYAGGNGIVGEANNGSAAFGVLGLSSSGYAGYFSGKVYISGNLGVGGTLTKAGGSFKIDHPLDPANKYLYHSFVESPDMKNIYDGIAALDDEGSAVVELPEWFEALNRDFRYQLTAIGSPGPNLHIAQEVQGNRFRIAGGTSKGKVSWQVTGIRHDAWADAHRILVEEDKLGREAGTYLHPELFGKPETSSVNLLGKKL